MNTQLSLFEGGLGFLQVGCEGFEVFSFADFGVCFLLFNGFFFF